MIKAQTVEQFKILLFIEKNFTAGTVKCELVDNKTVRVTDQSGESLDFRWDGGEVKW